MKNVCRKITSCRVCKQRRLAKVLTLGPTPLANAFITKKQLDQPERYFPLDVYFCQKCSMLQLGHVISPELLFGNYVYVSSTSPVFIKHFEDFVTDTHERFFLNSDSLVIDIGSNDGILLAPFKKAGTRVLGIEPAKKIARLAKKHGIPTLPNFFTVNLARKIVKKHGNADVITATNVFAHIDNLDEVISGLKVLLKEDGVFIIEAPYLIDFLKKRYFDLVYHEHLSYWSVRTLITIFQRFGMVVFDVQKVAVHGGSIRVFVKNKDGIHKTTQNVEKFLAQERIMKLEKEATYHAFAGEIQENKIALLRLLGRLKAEGKRIAAYGAPAKGNTLLNFFSIGTETLDYVVDDSNWKQGLFTPGKKIPVVSSKQMYVDRTDYMLVLAWNFAESIMQNHQRFKDADGKFIIPVPTPKVV
ncbi:MAG: class I SAM-dependent methyltransferase [Candidatus Levybacteria bacterium]|nr:class I SAM-dependent methyltransferase [Candidatus Levybacteria bacterium]